MHCRSRDAGPAVALAVTGALLAAGAAAAAPPPSDRRPKTPTVTARVAGIHRAGGAYMGWSAKGHGAPPRPAAAIDAARSGAVVDRHGAKTSGPQGVDVSSWQGNVHWRRLWKRGYRFAYVKATEGTYYSNRYFNQQYHGSYRVGMIHGAYHFAIPSVSSGSTQARYFVRHGGGWSANARTLPGVLDIEYNPYGGTCYGKTKRQMRAWISSFTHRYRALTGRDAVIYTNYDWWARCTGNTTSFNRTNPLWVARYAHAPGRLPGKWPFHTFWQYAASPIDRNQFNGSYGRLKALARG